MLETWKEPGEFSANVMFTAIESGIVGTNADQYWVNGFVGAEGIQDGDLRAIKRRKNR